MKSSATEAVRAMTLLVIAAFPTLALIAGQVSHAATRHAGASREGPVAGVEDSLLEGRCERSRHVGGVTRTRCD
jgi:hypothetical protein